ncbi:hypothetical protein [Loigolactobacillus coryniformis]|uniref:hypothetical protein n=2 Tax=Loigolactobacillus coryniformis TaxID=1610 RepID=UPI001C5D52C9|nr:hypothetical protein [Loigolactobacillus coryniformis]MBW4803861.1 hypothetical protein [Loigolactobacillus coryniformis subsp. torquens]
MVKKINLCFLYILTFICIYQPGVNNSALLYYSFYITVSVIMFLVLLFKKGKDFTAIIFNKQYVLLFIGIFLASLYFAMRALLGYQETRIFQNLLIIYQIIVVSMVIYILHESFDFKLVATFRFILNIGLIQAFFGGIMLVLPSLRQLALNLYYAGGPKNTFISGMRIYGISSDYTFFTPIFHGILGIMALNLAIKFSLKYLFYIPPFLLIILLNGRTGLIVFLFGSMVSLLVYMVRDIHYFVRSVALIIVSIIGFSLVIVIIQTWAPLTFQWLQGGLRDGMNFLNGNETGNFAALTNSLIFPKGIYFIFGMGFRLYGGNALHLGYLSSDIGYVNDIFMGGIVYAAILYFVIFRFIFKNMALKGSNIYFFERALNYSCIATLIIGNFKGEVMRSGLILLTTAMIKFIFIINLSDDIKD